MECVLREVKVDINPIEESRVREEFLHPLVAGDRKPGICSEGPAWLNVIMEVYIYL